MMGRARVAKGGGNGAMHGKGGAVGKSEAQLGERLRPFMAAMRHGDEIGDGQMRAPVRRVGRGRDGRRSEEHTSELQSLMRISYAVFCLKKKKTINKRASSFDCISIIKAKPIELTKQQHVHELKTTNNQTD